MLVVPLLEGSTMSDYEEAREQLPPHPADASAQAGDGTGELYRGWLGEVVKDAGPGRLTIWMLAWRCKRCGHCWPVSARQKTMAERGAARRRREREAALREGWNGPVPPPSTIDAGSLQERGSWMPGKCPACRTRMWWRDYVQPIDGPGRRGRRRQPAMLKLWRERGGRTLKREKAGRGDLPDAGSSGEPEQ